MRLSAPTKAPLLHFVDIYGQPVDVGKSGRRTLLCFFRDAACPFCNFRIYELTNRHAALQALGLDIVAVFTSTPEAVQRFVARKPRPFSVIADPTSRAHETYGIERSLWRKLKGIVTRAPTLVRGLRIVGLAGLNTTNLMPADFLIDEHGNIAEAYYGGDAGDRIPLERVELFLERGLVRRASRDLAEPAAQS
ncbi:redoxin domain-containing protein [Frateuria terrea]|uniref:Peroxiredoxin n=1 Tax=Frateuria terrea TaxID=529704 RepID=A0A1H6QK95_9GAMM|nr:redoxin domain-containing protein [Frateuria terrea]SEI44013.1 Peroxiredoxin [Frateuria terrea]SFP09457.1 Peroxiredoxin [Frateuria terrea]